jgi:hypothetical protein
MPKPPRARSALMSELEAMHYVHAPRRGFRRHGWTQAVDWRVVLHGDDCPKLYGAQGVCDRFGGVDILALKRTPGG